jgi:hypothetical protein
MLNFQPINPDFRDPMTWFGRNHGEIVMLVNVAILCLRLTSLAKQSDIAQQVHWQKSA